MNECPFCTSDKTAGEKSWSRFECGYLVQDGYEFTRPATCYERQLARLYNLLQEALEIVEWVSTQKHFSSELCPPDCALCKIPRKARVLAPKIKAELEKIK